MATVAGINEVIKEYQLRRDRYEVTAQQKLNELFFKNPELVNLRKKYALLRKNERKCPKLKLEDYKKEYKKTYKQYENLLALCIKQANISVKEIEYTPICKKCNDTGYIGDIQKKHCSCVITKSAQNILKGSNINNFETFANFDMDIFNDTDIVFENLTQKELMQKLFNFMIKWTGDFPNCDRQLLIMGNVGLGKSYILNAIAYELIKLGHTAMMITAFTINEAAFDEIKNSDSSALLMMRNVDLLLIDDLGSEQILKNITNPTLFNILNERIRYNKHTIVSTNMSAEQIEKRYGSRVFSRLIDKRRTALFPLIGKDLRSIT